MRMFLAGIIIELLATFASGADPPVVVVNNAQRFEVVATNTVHVGGQKITYGWSMPSEDVTRGIRAADAAKNPPVTGVRVLPEKGVCPSDNPCCDCIKSPPNSGVCKCGDNCQRWCYPIPAGATGQSSWVCPGSCGKDCRCLHPQQCPDACDVRKFPPLPKIVTTYQYPRGDHTHTCAAGHTWDHATNPTHTCNALVIRDGKVTPCGLPQVYQDVQSRMVTVTRLATATAEQPAAATQPMPVAWPSVGGCSSGNCSAPQRRIFFRR